MLHLGDLFTGQMVRLGATPPDFKELFARWSSDAEYSRMLNFDPAAPKAISEFEKEKDQDKEDPRHFGFWIRTLADDKPIGLTGFWVNWNNQSAWFWIGIGEADYRSKGYGTDTTRLMINYGFRELGLYRIGLGVFAYNVRAKRAYEKAGFVTEGIARSALYRDGQRHDIYSMAILRPEWEQMIQQQAQAVQGA